MRAEPVHQEDLDRVRELYLTAFPAYERAEWEKLLVHSRRDDSELLGLYDDGLIGLSYLIFDDEYLFILYLAISPDARGSGYGSQALGVLRDRHPDRDVFLNIEPPEDECDNREQRVRRKAFYMRNGFEPSWTLEISKDERYTMMCYGEPISHEGMDAFRLRHDMKYLFG